MDEDLHRHDSGTYLFVREGSPLPRTLTPAPSAEPLPIPKLDTGVFAACPGAPTGKRVRYRRGPLSSAGFDRRLAVAFAPASPAAERYRQLAAQILADRVPVLLITGTCAGAGRTTTAINLARAMAATHRVTLVDADVWLPGVAERFGLANAPGLEATLRERRRDPTAPIDLTLVTGSLAVLPAGHALAGLIAERMLAMPELDRVLAELAQVSDVVLVDAPPAGPRTCERLRQLAPDVLLVAPPRGWHDGTLQAARGAFGDAAVRLLINRV